MYYTVHTKKAARKLLPFLYLTLLVLFGFICYLNSFYNKFVWDDKDLVLKNALIHQPNIVKIFTQDLYNTNFSTTLFYRPLQNISYLLDYSLWGFNPVGYHLTNVLIHILNAILIYFLVGNITKDKILSLLTSLFFVSHPIHYGVVTYISGRADSLFTAFFLISFLAFIEYRKNYKTRFLLITLAFFIFSVLSKEMAIIVPVIFILYDLVYKPSPPKGMKKWSRLSKHILLPYFVFGVLLCIYGALRLSHFKISMLAKFPGGGVYVHVLTFPRIVIQYFISLLAPLDLYMRKSIGLAQSLWEPEVLISFFLVTVAIIIGFKLRKKNRGVSFFIFYFLITLLPVSNIIVRVNALRADHWLYMPSIGYFFVISYYLLSICDRAFKVKPFNVERIGFSFGIILIAIYALITIKQNLYWKDEVTFFTELLRHRPNDPLVRGNLGLAYLEKKEFEKALQEEKRLIELFPNYAEGHCNAGMIYYGMERFDEAFSYFKEAVVKDDTLATPHLYLGLIYEKKKNYPDAEIEFRKYIELCSYSSLGYVNMGILKFNQNEIDQALNFFNVAIEKNPANTTAYLYLGTIYRKRNEFVKALMLLEKAVEIEPDNVGILMDLGNIYTNFGLFDKAIACFRKAIIASPDNSKSYYNMGNTYRLQKDLDRAKRYWRRALEINPKFKEALDSLEALK